MQFDEKWSFVAKKEKHCDRDDPADDACGDCWDHVAIDAESRLVLSVVPDDRICVTRRAVLGFHAARSVDQSGRSFAEPEASDLVLQTYPAAVRGWIRRRGGLSSRLLVLRGRELAAIYPSCR